MRKPVSVYSLSIIIIIIICLEHLIKLCCKKILLMCKCLCCICRETHWQETGEAGGRKQACGYFWVMFLSVIYAARSKGTYSWEVMHNIWRMLGMKLSTCPEVTKRSRLTG